VRNEMGQARLLIADDQLLIRLGMRAIIESEPGLELVGEAEDGQQAVELCRELKPNLVLMDVQMPRMDGLEATTTIKEENPAISVLVVTAHEDTDYLLKAIKAGAAGYVLKDAPRNRLLNTIHRVLEGESPLNQELAMQLIRSIAADTERQPVPFHESSTGPPTPDRKRDEGQLVESLTPREVEVLRLLVAGKTNRQIAQEMYVSLSTVKTHVERIIRKLGVSDRTQAAVRAVEIGLRVDQDGR
jgi:DNA-binding NarL/FixJ family response regulator